MIKNYDSLYEAALIIDQSRLLATKVHKLPHVYVRVISNTLKIKFVKEIFKIYKNKSKNYSKDNIFAFEQVL